MEIASFFRLSVRRVVVLVVVGLVAAGIAGAVALRSGAKYQGTAVMFTAQVLKPGTPQYALQPVTDNLLNMVFTTKVVLAAAKASGESAGQIAGNLEAGPAGTNDVQVTYTSPHAAAVPVVLQTVAHRTLLALGQAQLTSAEAVVSQAQGDVDKAAKNLANFEAQHGTAATAPHEALADEVNRARGALSDANGAVAEAHDVITRSKLASVVAVSGASKQSQASDVARAAATAGVASVALLLLVMFVTDWRRSRDDELMLEARRRARQDAGPIPSERERGRTRKNEAASGE